MVQRFVLALSFVMALLGGVRNRVESEAEAEQIAERSHDIDAESHGRDKLRGVTRHEFSRFRSGPAWVAVSPPAVRVVLKTHRADGVRWAGPRRSLPAGDDDDDERTGC